MRDKKNSLLKILNFYRSIQKRISYELMEFAGRETLDTSSKVLAPEEAKYINTKSEVIV
jgi:hypothetical protein